MNVETSGSAGRQYGWASGINILLGVWIMISPFVLAFSHPLPAVWGNIVVGFVVGLFALIRASGAYHQPGWSWGNTLLGLWLIISPFLLGFTHVVAITVNNIVVGVVVGLLALTSALATKPSKAAAPTTP